MLYMYIRCDITFYKNVLPTFLKGCMQVANKRCMSDVYITFVKTLYRNVILYNFLTALQ